MTDSDQPPAPEEEEVRRLLAAARHTGETPPEVVARLDRVLDDLAHEPEAGAPLVDLARRRRRAAALLVAAAFVGVVGIGVGQVLSTQSGSDTSSAGASRQQEDAGSDSVQPKSGDSFASGAQPHDQSAPAPVAPRNTENKSALVELRRDHLAEDVSRLPISAANPQTDGTVRAGAGSAARAAGAACGVDAWGAGRFVAVRYAGTPAVLVFRRPVGDTQVADLFLCGSKEPVRSVTLPVP